MNTDPKTLHATLYTAAASWAGWSFFNPCKMRRWPAAVRRELQLQLPDQPDQQQQLAHCSTAAARTTAAARPTAAGPTAAAILLACLYESPLCEYYQENSTVPCLVTLFLKAYYGFVCSRYRWPTDWSLTCQQNSWCLVPDHFWCRMGCGFSVWWAIFKIKCQKSVNLTKKLLTVFSR